MKQSKKKSPIQHLVPNNPQADKQLTGGGDWDAKAEAEAKKKTLYDSSYKTAAGHWKQRDEPDEAEQLRQSDRIQQMLQAKRQRASRDRLKGKGAIPTKQGKKFFNEFMREAKSHQMQIEWQESNLNGLTRLRYIYNAANDLEFKEWIAMANSFMGNKIELKPRSD
jgi:hypothetical protein